MKVQSVCTDTAFIQNFGPCGCKDRMVYRSVWDRLCQQLFGAMPPGMSPEDQLPDVEIFESGISLQGEENGEFSFTVTTSGDAPKPFDVISYKGQFYIIGEVDD